MVTGKAKSTTRRAKASASSEVSRITVTFEGLLMLFFNEKKRFCDVGILKDVPKDHPARILIIKKKNGASEILHDLPGDKLETRLWLDVQKQSPDIKARKGISFTRKSGNNDDDDIRWSLDFEGGEMYRDKIKVDLSGFRAILRINDGEFHTIKYSENELSLKKPGEDEKAIGAVATKIGADIQLSKRDVAYFSNGSYVLDPPLSAEEGVTYEIQVSQSETHNAKREQPLTQVDAESYYNVVASDLAPSRKIHFSVKARVTPDASCLTAVMSKSDSGF